MRIVSLVQSITETLFAFGLTPSELVGRTDWCVRPAELVSSVQACGGTKNPRLDAILALRPDVVLLDAEENRREDAEALRASGLRVHAFHVRTVADTAAMVRTLGEIVARPLAAEPIAAAIEAALSTPCTPSHQGDAPTLIPLIWHQPLMSVAATRYTGDLLTHAGFRVLARGDAGYPRWTLDELAAAKPDVLLLSEEPHDFTAEEAQELRQALSERGHSSVRVVKWEAGHELTWFGVATVEAMAQFKALCAKCALPWPPC